MALTKHKLAMVAAGIEAATDCAIEELNPQLFPGDLKPVAYYQINFEDAESFLIPIFSNMAKQGG